MDSIQPATTISDAPVAIACAASATAFSSDPQTMLMVSAATESESPPRSAACREVYGGAPIVRSLLRSVSPNFIERREDCSTSAQKNAAQHRFFLTLFFAKTIPSLAAKNSLQLIRLITGRTGKMATKKAAKKVAKKAAKKK